MAHTVLHEYWTLTNEKRPAPPPVTGEARIRKLGADTGGAQLFDGRLTLRADRIVERDVSSQLAVDGDVSSGLFNSFRLKG